MQFELVYHQLSLYVSMEVYVSQIASENRIIVLSYYKNITGPKPKHCFVFHSVNLTLDLTGRSERCGRVNRKRPYYTILLP